MKKVKTKNVEKEHLLEILKYSGKALIDAAMGWSKTEDSVPPVKEEVALASDSTTNRDK